MTVPATSPAVSPASPARSVQATVRRIIVFLLLFVLVIVAATGLAGLIGRILDVEPTLARDDTSALALSLAFTLIGGPLTAVLWRVMWRRLTELAERGSFAWGFYVAAASTVSLIIASSSAIAALSALVDGQWLPSEAATALVWLGVWVWHRWMRLHPARGPQRLQTVAPVIASYYGLIIGAGGAIMALRGLFGEIARGLGDTSIIGSPWWHPVLQSLVWATIGALIWSWHWMREHVGEVRTGFSAVALVLVGTLGASIAALTGAGSLLFVALRLLVDFVDPLTSMIEPAPLAVAAALVGAVVWRHHAGVVAHRSPVARSSAALVLSGVGVAAAATGIGVVINATLAAISPALAGSDPRTLVLGGVSTFVVGAPLWWVVWRPTRGAVPAAAASTGRRVYLIAVFGISAIVALITLLVMGFRVFEFVLGDVSGAGVIDRIRAPLGLLVATVLVAGYHFAIWRRDRAALAAAGGTHAARTIGRIYLVASDGATADQLSAAIREATGAGVTVWRRAGVDAHSPQSAAPAVAPTIVRVLAALDGVRADRALVIVGIGEQIQVIPLAE